MGTTDGHFHVLLHLDQRMPQWNMLPLSYHRTEEMWRSSCTYVVNNRETSA